MTSDQVAHGRGQFALQPRRGAWLAGHAWCKTRAVMRFVWLSLLAACSPFAVTPEPGRGHGGSVSVVTDAPGPYALAGINLPPTQGTSNAGAFLPGISTWSYTDAQLAAASSTFDIVRLPINVATANDPTTLALLQGIVDQMPAQRAILCLFGTSTTGDHGTGVVDDVAAATAAWMNIDAVFGGYPNVHYEIFNEPFGYTKADPTTYVTTMTQIITGAGLPPQKCILDGMGYADDIQLVAGAGWTGDVGYHFYPNWSSDPEQSTYSNLVQGAIGALGPRTWITEFGANLSYPDPCYQTYEDGAQPSSADVNALRGLDDAVGALRAAGNGLEGVVSWHGWDNGDSYDFWDGSNAQGACKVRLIQSDS
jgi:hypothetical protein